MACLPEMPLDRLRRRLSDAEDQRSATIADPGQPDMPLVYVTSAFEQQTGYSSQEVLGRNCRFLRGPETDPADVAAIREAIAAWRSLTIDILNYRKDGTPFWNRLRLRPTFRDGRLDSYVGAQNPIPEDAVERGPKFDLPNAQPQ